mgnify:CR=1 FL=1
MTKKERVKELVKAVAYINSFEETMNNMGFEWSGETILKNNPINACDIIVHEIEELLDVDRFDIKSDKLVNNISSQLNTSDTYERQFDIIWKEFGTDES